PDTRGGTGEFGEQLRPLLGARPRVAAACAQPCGPFGDMPGGEGLRGRLIAVGDDSPRPRFGHRPSPPSGGTVATVRVRTLMRGARRGVARRSSWSAAR